MARHGRVRLLFGAASCALMLTTAPAFAQDMNPTAAKALDGAETEKLEQSFLGDIVVTARKRSEEVQNVPDAVSVISYAVVEAGDLDQIDDFVNLVPNANFSTDGETSSEVSIRGSARNLADEDPSVGIYRDGIYVGGLLFSTATFYDVERVEILRGPQAALYGRNAVGGAVNVITRRPSFERTGFAELQVGSKSRQEFRAALNMPIVEDKLALRVSGYLANQDKGFDYIVNQDLYTDAEEIASVRGRLLFAPTPDVEFLTTVEYIDTKGGFPLLVAAPDRAVGYLDSNFFVEIPGTRADETGNQFRDYPTYRNFDQFHVFQEVNWTTGAGTLTGLVSYREANLGLARDDDYTNLTVSGRTYDAKQESFFSELRFATSNPTGLNVLVGLNYLDEATDLSYDNLLGGNFYGALGGVNLADMYASGVTPPQFEAFGIPTGTPIDALGLTPGATGLTGFLGDSFPLLFTNQQKLKSFAAFGAVTYQFSPQFGIWGNARYTRDRKNITFGQNYNDCPVSCGEIVAFLLDGLDFEVNGTNSATFENVSLGGGVNFQPNESLLLYAKVVEGFKAGGFNPIAASLDLQVFDSEQSISYEIGLKSEFFDKRLRVNVAAFLQDRTGTLVDVEDPLLDVLELGVNAGKIRNKGVELEISAAPVKGLRFDVAAGYLDARFREFEFGNENFIGNRVPRTFEYTFSAIATYKRPITERLDLFGFLSYRNAWGGFTDNENDRELDNPEVIDLRLGIESAAGWRINGFVDNLLDNRYRSFDVGGSRIPRGTFAPGRTYGVQLRYEF